MSANREEKGADPLVESLVQMFPEDFLRDTPVKRAL
jgi:hypothetical protein